MADEYSHFDAAYVLGALNPEDRLAFEAHLATCAACTQAVQVLAGMPGLLARADISLSEEIKSDEQPPDLLPQLLASAQNELRRRRLLSGSGWFAAAAAAAALIFVVVIGPISGPVASTAAPLTPMVAVANSPMAGQVGLTGVAWGTRIELKCTTPADYSDDEPYELVLYDRQGVARTVGSWRVIPGRTSTMNASTDLVAADIERVEVRPSTSDEAVLILHA
jgi:anti-sigma-K factor RskA